MALLGRLRTLLRHIPAKAISCKHYSVHNTTPFISVGYPSKYSETFQYWILQSFKENQGYCKFKKKLTINYDTKDVAQFISTASLEELLTFMSQEKYLSCMKNNKVAIDRRLLSVGYEKDLEGLLKVFDVFIDVYSSEIGSMESFNKLVQLGVQKLGESHSPQHILQFISYVSYGKSSTQAKLAVSLALKKLSVNDLRKLNEVEIGILCNSIFRTSTLMPQNLLLYVEEYFLENVKAFMDHPSALTSLVKVFRHANHSSPKILEVVASEVLQADYFEKLFISQKIHLFALLSNTSYSDIHLAERVSSLIMSEVQSLVDRKQFLRLKDLDMLLWAISVYYGSFKTNLDVRLQQCIVGSIKPKTFPYALGATLWLWVLEHKERESIFETVIKQNMDKLQGIKSFKDSGKLNLLLTCVALEAPHLMTEKLNALRDRKLTPRVSKYLKTRKGFARILNLLERNKRKFGINEVLCDFPIPGLYIGSIAVYLKGNSILPGGRMKLKQRLMQKSGLSFVTVDVDDVSLKDLSRCLRASGVPIESN